MLNGRGRKVTGYGRASGMSYGRMGWWVRALISGINHCCRRYGFGVPHVCEHCKLLKLHTLWTIS